MFKPVRQNLNVTTMEEDILQFWRKHDIFQQSMQDQRRGGQEYVFYEGPPTANGKPGVHHVLARAFKDIFPRYQDHAWISCQPARWLGYAWFAG